MRHFRTVCIEHPHRAATSALLGLLAAAHARMIDARRASRWALLGREAISSSFVLSSDVSVSFLGFFVIRQWNKREVLYK